MKCLCASTRRAARLLTRYYEQELRAANVTPAQFELLGTLSARPDLPQSDLAEAVGVDQTTLSRNLKVLIGRKWVKRKLSVKDRRGAIYSLDSEGRKAFSQAMPSWQRAQSHLQQKLGRDWDHVWSTLDRMAQLDLNTNNGR